VEAAGDVGGGYEIQQRLVLLDARFAESFAEVGVQING